MYVHAIYEHMFSHLAAFGQLCFVLAPGESATFATPLTGTLTNALRLHLPHRRNGASSTASEPLRPNLDGSHHLQEYTYKKITACDVCSQILRGGYAEK